MKEAFETMASHPKLTVFLGLVFLLTLNRIFEFITDIIKKR